jgi:hypothetical protein
VREVVARSVSEPNAVLKWLGEPKRGEVQKLYHSPELTILNVVWAPYMTIYPHNHRMWAVIGVYTGREDNIFWRNEPETRSKPPARRRCRARRGSARPRHHPLGDQPDPAPHRRDPRLRRRLLRIERSEWDPETLAEGRYDAQKTMRHFEQANARS